MFPEIIIDLSPLEELVLLSPGALLWFVFVRGGWVPLLIALVMGMWWNWRYYRMVQWSATQKFVLLAIDVPRNNEQSPLAVENMLAQMAGTHGSDNAWQIYWIGQYQLSFSLEIVSIDGYIQFLIYTPEKWRDLMETAVYAQYPDAEINEIDDYTTGVPSQWPDPEWRFFGLEYKLAKSNAYPLRLWTEFEDKLSGELKDPMAGLMEIMGRMAQGEQIWLQFVLKPIVEKDWTKESDDEVNKIIKRKSEQPKPKIMGKILGAPFTFAALLLGLGVTEPEKKKEDNPDASIMMQLPPGEKDLVEAIEKKASKHAYRVKTRIMYFARNALYSKTRGVSATVGAMKQYNSGTTNRLDVQKHVWTQTKYIVARRRLAWRQNKLYRAYKGRSTIGGAGEGSVLNIEELATMWHFPVMQVKAPLLKRTEIKRSQAPFALPLARPKILRETPAARRTPPPTADGLPFVPEEKELPRAKQKQQAPAPQARFASDTISEEKADESGPPGNLPFV